ncbi:hypothetical protein QQX98_007986 [Neonectria punicea]|uniref:Uncharacterized protein n=1 Tax=Neonectria punicea TaxID=979145 RepID=A0ABR1GWE8_9HYPO
MSRKERLAFLESMRVLKKIDAVLGNIVMCETNMLDASGGMRTWVWFKITKPLMSSHGRLPPELTPTPEAWLVFAIPTMQVVKLKET